MENIVLYVLGWTFLMTPIIAVLPEHKARQVTRFFEKVLPKIPITGIINAFRKPKSRGG
jgi:hypothetical protein